MAHYKLAMTKVWQEKFVNNTAFEANILQKQHFDALISNGRTHSLAMLKKIGVVDDATLRALVSRVCQQVSAATREILISEAAIPTLSALHLPFLAMWLQRFFPDQPALDLGTVCGGVEHVRTCEATAKYENSFGSAHAANRIKVQAMLAKVCMTRAERQRDLLQIKQSQEARKETLVAWEVETPPPYFVSEDPMAMYLVSKPTTTTTPTTTTPTTITPEASAPVLPYPDLSHDNNNELFIQLSTPAQLSALSLPAFVVPLDLMARQKKENATEQIVPYVNNYNNFDSVSNFSNFDGLQREEEQNDAVAVVFAAEVDDKTKDATTKKKKKEEEGRKKILMAYV